METRLHLSACQLDRVLGSFGSSSRVLFSLVPCWAPVNPQAAPRIPCGSLPTLLPPQSGECVLFPLVEQCTCVTSCQGLLICLNSAWNVHCSCVDGVLGFLAEALASLGRRPHHFWDLMKTILEAHTSDPSQGSNICHSSNHRPCIAGSHGTS